MFSGIENLLQRLYLVPFVGQFSFEFSFVSLLVRLVCLGNALLADRHMVLLAEVRQW